MNTRVKNVELWLRSERQQMARPDALTAFLSKKDEMLAAVVIDPEDSRNTGASKARTHIGNCFQLANLIDCGVMNPHDSQLKMGELAAKAFKVASGYSMRAGYFHPSTPSGLYRERMVELIDESGESLPVLGEVLTKLTVDDKTTGILSAADLMEVIDYGKTVASSADEELKELLESELSTDPQFSGSADIQTQAQAITRLPKVIFAQVGMSALSMQYDGPQGLGPVIVEPKSDADAHYFLHIDSLTHVNQNGITSVSSPQLFER